MRIEPDHDRLRPVGRLPAVAAVGALDAAAADPLARVAGPRDPEARVRELAIETAGPDREDVADRRLVLAEVERRRPWRRDDPVRRCAPIPAIRSTYSARYHIELFVT